MKRRKCDANVVSYNKSLLLWGKCHINVVYVGDSNIIAYLFKYMLKNPGDPEKIGFTLNEHYWYYKGRYMGSSYAEWKIECRQFVNKSISVQRLPIHLQNRSIVYRVNNDKFVRCNNAKITLLEIYLSRPNSITVTVKDEIRKTDVKKTRDLTSLTYIEFCTIFIATAFNNKPTTIEPKHAHFQVLCASDQLIRDVLIHHRNESRKHICRIKSVQPSAGEIYYFRLCLQHSPLQGWTPMYQNEPLQSYQQLAFKLGIVSEKNVFEPAMRESVDRHVTPADLRMEFVVHALQGAPASLLWDTFQFDLSKDFFYDLQQDLNYDIQRAQKVGVNCALEDIRMRLLSYQRTLADYGLPDPELTADELKLAHYFKPFQTMSLADCDKILKDVRLNADQKMVHDIIMNRITDDNVDAANPPVTMFIDGQSGRGKTYCLNVIAADATKHGKNVLIVATTAIAALNYTGGSTAHRAFGIQVRNEIDMDENEKIVCVTSEELRQRIKQISLIIWDEFPMAHKADVIAVHEMLNQLNGVPFDKSIPFGGIHFIGAGDFRQIPPVVQFGNRTSIFETSIISSDLFKQKFTIYRLTIPMRDAHDQEHSRLVDALGNGIEQSYEKQKIDDKYLYINNNMCFTDYVRFDGYQHTCDTQDGIEFVYPNIGSAQVDYKNVDSIAQHVLPFMNSRILSNTHASSKIINDICVQKIPTPLHKLIGISDLSDNYNSHVPVQSNTVHTDDENIISQSSQHLANRDITHPPAAIRERQAAKRATFFESLQHNNVPPHLLELKVGSICTILRNIDVTNRLVNNARIIIEDISPSVIFVGMIMPDGTWRHNIPIVPIAFHFCVKSTRLEVTRRQFPIAPDYSSTVHRSQGQTLTRALIDVRQPVFTHGMLYVGTGRTKASKDLKFLCLPTQLDPYNAAANTPQAPVALSLTFSELLLPTHCQPPFKLIDALNAPPPQPPPAASAIIPIAAAPIILPPAIIAAPPPPPLPPSSSLPPQPNNPIHLLSDMDSSLLFNDDNNDDVHDPSDTNVSLQEKSAIFDCEVLHSDIDTERHTLHKDLSQGLKTEHSSQLNHNNDDDDHEEDPDQSLLSLSITPPTSSHKQQPLKIVAFNRSTITSSSSSSSSSLIQPLTPTLIQQPIVHMNDNNDCEQKQAESSQPTSSQQSQHSSPFIDHDSDIEDFLPPHLRRN